MSDPALSDSAVELGKLGGSAFSGGVLTLLLGRLFGSQDKALEQVLVELKALTASVSALSSQLAVITSSNSRRDADQTRLESRLDGQDKTIAEQGKAIAKIEATLEQLSEGILR